MICDTCCHINVCKKKAIIVDKINKITKNLNDDTEDITFEFQCKDYQSYMIRTYKEGIEWLPSRIYGTCSTSRY